MGGSRERWESEQRPYSQRLLWRSSPPCDPRNLAACAGRWSATHRKTAIIGWILFVVLATVIGSKIGQKNLDPSAMGNGESKRGDMIVADAGFPETIGERVLISAQAHGKGQRSSPRGPSVAQPLGHTVSHFLSSVLSLPRHVPDDE